MPTSARSTRSAVKPGPHHIRQRYSRPVCDRPVLDFSFRVLVPESKMIQAERAKFTNVSVPTLIFLDQWILLQNVIPYTITSV